MNDEIKRAISQSDIKELDAILKSAAERKKKLEDRCRGLFEKNPGTGIWWIRWTDSAGRIRRKKVGSKELASKLVEKNRSDAWEGKLTPKNLRAKPITFGELAKAALAYSERKKRSYKADVSRMKVLVREFGQCAAESITPTQISNFLDSSERGWSTATRNRHLALLKLAFRLAEVRKPEEGGIKYNPARLVRQTKENNFKKRHLRPAEEAALRLVIARDYPEHMPEFDLALLTGMRRSEQYTMTWENVDLEERVVYVPLSKSGQSREVDLNSRAVEILANLKKQSLGTGRVFLSDGPRYWFEPAVRKAGLSNFTWHGLRHSFATRLLQKGVDLRDVQVAMGHGSIAMTARYAYVERERRREVVQTLVFSPTSTPTDTGDSAATRNSEAVQ